MKSRPLRITAVITLCCFLLSAQLDIQVRSAVGNSNGVTGAGHQKGQAILAIHGNEPISVNGASVITGATILSGATIKTPERVGAVVMLGSLGTLNIAPTSTLTADFDQNSSVRVGLIQGCLILHARKDISGEVVTPQGVARKTDPKAGGALDVCFPQSGLTETRATPMVERPGGGGLLALGRAAAEAIIAGRIGASMGRELAERGKNPGPSAP